MFTFAFFVAMCIVFGRSRTQNLLKTGLPICSSVNDDSVLSEVHNLNIGWPRDIYRVGLLLAICVAIGFRAWDYYTNGNGGRWNDNITGAVVDGFFAAALVCALPILGWNPCQWGMITLDTDQLRVPGMFNVRVFKRDRATHILARRGVGGSYFHCLIQDESQSAEFFINPKSYNLLQIWASSSTK